MSETRPPYATGRAHLRPQTLLQINDPQFEAPNDRDVQALKDLSGLTGGELAKLVGVDARTFRAWSASPEAERRQRIPYAAWRLLLIELGYVEHIAAASNQQI